MRFKIDENLPIEAAALLGSAGHDVATVYDEGLVGGTDARLAETCHTEARALVTRDTDFADIRAYPPRQYSGLVVLRLRSPSKVAIIALLARTVPVFEREELLGRLWVVGEQRIRIRE